MVYHVPLLLDIATGVLLIYDPSTLYYIELNRQKIGWFRLMNYTFIHLHPGFPNSGHIRDGFYALLSAGAVNLYKSFSKTFKDDPSSSG
ncbi:MAG TPA: hypothetical protein VG847_08050 [Chitinophagaceae bacterium]|nr:hypothetical protein [Chitinophagaceae bacterium]